MTKKRSNKRRRETRPIFIVGSPRSGTSILTWCISQHPNILPLAESAWLGDFAFDLAVRFSAGSARGALSQLSSVGIEEDEFFARFGDAIDRLILSHRDRIEELLPEGHPAWHPFKLWRSKSDPKLRWADGTPEYSFHIYGLRKLFPKAVFIHLVRDVSSVVRSMMNFPRVGGRQLVATEEEAYRYWLRAVRACLQAEKAYGPKIVNRLRYSDLVTNSKDTIRAVLKFLGEPYAAACLEPLDKKINSSEVPSDFCTGEARASRELVAEAEQLSTELQKNTPLFAPSALVAEEMESAFRQRTQYIATLDLEYHRTQKVVSELQKELEERVAWALKCDKESTAKDSTILRLQKELKERTAWALKCNEESTRKDAVTTQLQKELEERTAWALKCNEESTRKDAVIRDLQKQLKQQAGSA